MIPGHSEPSDAEIDLPGVDDVVSTEEVKWYLAELPPSLVFTARGEVSQVKNTISFNGGDNG